MHGYVGCIGTCHCALPSPLWCGVVWLSLGLGDNNLMDELICEPKSKLLVS